MTSELRDFLEIPYDGLEDLNLEAKSKRLDHTPADTIREERMRYLADQKGIKAVTVCFSDLEGRLHMLDYDKKFLLKSADNLTFDGSSIRGFSQQAESDLRLAIDWPAFYWLPADIFGPGKVLVFSDVLEKDGTPYVADMLARLKTYLDRLHQKDGYTCNAANEIEGFLFKGRDAERRYFETGGVGFPRPAGHYPPLSRGNPPPSLPTPPRGEAGGGVPHRKGHP